MGQCTVTEYEKKQSGEIYDARDAELRMMQNTAKDLMKEYNNLSAADTEGRFRVLQLLIGDLGSNVRVNQPFYVDYGKNIYIGDNTVVNLDCTMLDTGKITIGHHTLIGPNVKIYTALHAKNGEDRYWYEENGISAVKTMTEPVSIGDYVWIGGGAIILPGVSIGNNVVIGAGSVVTKSIPDGAIACGNPCTVKGYNNPVEIK